MFKPLLAWALMLSLLGGCSKKEAAQNAPAQPPVYAPASIVYTVSGYPLMSSGASVELETFPGARTDRYEVRIVCDLLPVPGSTTNGVQSPFLYYNKPSKDAPDTDFVLHGASFTGFDSQGFFGYGFSSPFTGTLKAGTKPGTWSGTFSAGSGSRTITGEFVNLPKR